MKSKALTALLAAIAVPVVLMALPFLAPSSFAAPPAPGAPGQPVAGALSVTETAELAHQAGFRGDALVIATAIPGAESKYVPDALGDLYPIKGCECASHGLWQIRSCPHRDPAVTYDTSGCHPPLDRGKQAELDDPADNARVAFSLATSPGGWGNWSTYTDNAYLVFMPAAQAAVASLPGGGS